jgi:hypothetical protein
MLGSWKRRQATTTPANRIHCSLARSRLKGIFSFFSGTARQLTANNELSQKPCMSLLNSDTHSRRIRLYWPSVPFICSRIICYAALAVDVAGRPPCRHIRMHQLRCAARNPARASTLLPPSISLLITFHPLPKPSALLKRTLASIPENLPSGSREAPARLALAERPLNPSSPRPLPRRAGLGAHSTHQISSMRLSSGESGSFPPIVRVRLTL